MRRNSLEGCSSARLTKPGSGLGSQLHFLSLKFFPASWYISTSFLRYSLNIICYGASLLSPHSSPPLPACWLWTSYDCTQAHPLHRIDLTCLWADCEPTNSTDCIFSALYPSHLVEGLGDIFILVKYLCECSVTMSLHWRKFRPRGCKRLAKYNGVSKWRMKAKTKVSHAQVLSPPQLLIDVWPIFFLDWKVQRSIFS